MRRRTRFAIWVAGLAAAILSTGAIAAIVPVTVRIFTGETLHGGASHNHGSMRLVNVTITGNHANISTSPFVGGGGIYNAGNLQFPSATCGAGIPIAPTTPIGTLGADGTYPLLLLPNQIHGIDRGTALGCPTEDQAGRPRPLDGDRDGNAICDSGATEYDAGPPRIPDRPRNLRVE